MGRVERRVAVIDGHATSGVVDEDQHGGVPVDFAAAVVGPVAQVRNDVNLIEEPGQRVGRHRCVREPVIVAVDDRSVGGDLEDVAAVVAFAGEECELSDDPFGSENERAWL
ncbi:MAG: hypothetical protein ACSLFO_02365 [Acidimicrobiales bacterium]